MNHVLRNLNCNPVHVTEMESKVYHDTILYHKGTNIIDVANLVGPSMMSAGKIFKVKHWDLLLLGGLNGIRMCLKI